MPNGRADQEGRDPAGAHADLPQREEADHGERLQHGAAERGVEIEATSRAACLALWQRRGAGKGNGHAVFSVWMSSSAHSAWK
jgi:hypothetical protein